jgi:hypothetical protein
VAGIDQKGYRRDPRTRHAHPLYLARGSASSTSARSQASARAGASAPRLSASQNSSPTHV